MQKIMKRFLAVLVVLMSLVGASQATAQVWKYFFNGLWYTWPPTHASGMLQNDGLGNLTWNSAGATANLVAWSTAGSCPTGWAEYTAGRGRYLVGKPSGATVETTVGTALTNSEDRAVGTHTHTSTSTVTLNDAGHVHGKTDPTHFHGQIRSQGLQGDSGGGAFDMVQDTGGNTPSALTGITINAATPNITTTGTPSITNLTTQTGTNAPYVQLIVCKKS